MTPFEIALAIRNRPNDDEGVEIFVQRTMPKEKMSDFAAALDLLVSWETAYEDIENLCDALRGVEAKGGGTIATLIVEKRKLGYDQKLEALLARHWRCPHCKQYATIEGVELPIGEPDQLPRCVICREDGIAPIETRTHLDVRDGGKSGLKPVNF